MRLVLKKYVNILGLVILTSPSVTTLADDAKLTTVGSELQVNTHTTSSQLDPKIGIDSEGDFVVVWTSDGGNGDNENEAVQGQRYASDGSPRGSEFLINTYTTSVQQKPAVGVATNGDFVVVWQSIGSMGSDTSSGSIQGQLYASDGTARGGQFQVNSHTTMLQAYPAVAVASSGDFLVVWESFSSPGTDSDSRSVVGRRFASDGSPRGTDFQVNTYTTSEQTRPAAVAVDDEGFVVVWTSSGSSGTDSSSSSIQGQRYASNGSQMGEEFQVNAYTSQFQGDPAVAATDDGDFVVVWESSESGGTDSLYSSVQGRRFTSDGSALGSDFQVNTFTSSYETDVRVALDAAGGFAVIWSSGDAFRAPDGPDGSLGTVLGQRYASDGERLGSEFQVNTYTTSSQGNADVVSGPNGGLVVVWNSSGSSGTDTSSTSIQGQRYVFEADLGITKDDGVDSADPGGTLVYVIVATNAGPDSVSGVTVSDIFPADLTCSWMSMATGGATGNTASSGDLVDTLSMPVGSTVTYTVTCDIDSEAFGTLLNKAEISAAVVDAVPGNNIAIDTTGLPADLFSDGFESGNTSVWSNSVP